MSAKLDGNLETEITLLTMPPKRRRGSMLGVIAISMPGKDALGFSDCKEINRLHRRLLDIQSVDRSQASSSTNKLPYCCRQIE